jgi:hypothetical protein
VSEVFDTASNHLFDSWTDKDLYRAIDNPEHPGDGAEIAEYVSELQKRVVERARLALRSAEIRRQHNIPDPE